MGCNLDLGVEGVAHDREQPGFQPRARLEAVEAGNGFRQRFLDQIVSVVRITAERSRKCSEGWDDLNDRGCVRSIPISVV